MKKENQSFYSNLSPCGERKKISAENMLGKSEE